MRFCERCGAKNDDNSRFCIACGQPVNADDPGMTPAAGGAPVAVGAPMAVNAAASAGAVRTGAAASAGSPMAGNATSAGATRTGNAASAGAPTASNAPDPLGTPMGKATASPAHATPAHAADAPAIVSTPVPMPEPIPVGYETNEFPSWQDNPQPTASAIPAATAGELSALAQGQAEAQTLLRDADEKIAAIDERLANMEKAFADLADQFQEKISRNEHEATALKQVSAEIEEYRNGLYEKLTMPFIRDIIDVRAGMESMLARHAAQESVPTSEVAVFCQMLADTLSKNSVEIIASEEGDEFLSFKHKAVGQVPTTDASLHGRIAAVEGESYRLGDQYIAPALVKIYTLEDSASETAGN